jgi:hypothetical protein
MLSAKSLRADTIHHVQILQRRFATLSNNEGQPETGPFPRSRGDRALPLFKTTRTVVCCVTIQNHLQKKGVLTAVRSDSTFPTGLRTTTVLYSADRWRSHGAGSISLVGTRFCMQGRCTCATARSPIQGETR